MTAPAHMTTLVPEGAGPFMTAFVSTLLAEDVASRAVGGRRSFKLAVVDRNADIEAGYDLVLLAGEIGCATTTIKRIVQDLDIRRPGRRRRSASASHRAVACRPWPRSSPTYASVGRLP